VRANHDWILEQTVFEDLGIMKDGWEEGFFTLVAN
jgi:hypothetical protein